MQNTGAKRKIKIGSVIKISVASVLMLSVAVISLGFPGWRNVFSFFGVYADLGEKFSASFVNIGASDACCVKCGDKSLLIDSGADRLSNRLTGFLRRYEFKAFDAAVVTYPDSEHIGAMADIIEQFGIDKIYLPSLPEKLLQGNEDYERLINSAIENNVTLVYPKFGETVEIGDMKLSFIFPEKAYEKPLDNSLAVRLDFGSHRLLITDNISEEAEKDLLSCGAELDCDVLKTVNYGSESTPSEALLEAVSPDISVVSVYMPDYSTMARINSHSSELYRTDRDNTVTITSDGENLKVHTDS